MKMTLPSSLAFSVRRCEPELVVPAKPTPHEMKKLSDIDDQEGLRFQLPFIMFYSKNTIMEGNDPVKVIREALGEALVYYYPFAGRLREGPNRKLSVDCTGEGILFIEADADISLEKLVDTIQPPCPCIEELLYDVPGSTGILGCPLLLIQVTRLKCGGFIFAVRLNHTMSDSLGLVQFLNTVGEIARGERRPSQQPVWQREILNARDPPSVTCVHHEYEELKDANSTKMTMDRNNMVHQSVSFTPKDMRSIRKHLPPHLHKCSNFEVLTACLWRCRTIALDLDPDEIVRVSCMINVRGKQGLKLPSRYYGNAFAFPTALSRAKLICKNPLGYALELVKMTKTQMSEGYIRSVADLMVIKGRPSYTRVWNFLAADTTRVGFGEIDFGWGKAVYGGPTGAIPCVSFYARYTNSEGEECTVVPIWLPPPVMERFQEELVKMKQEEHVGDSYSIMPATITTML